VSVYIKVAVFLPILIDINNCCISWSNPMMRRALLHWSVTPVSTQCKTTVATSHAIRISCSPLIILLTAPYFHILAAKLHVSNNITPTSFQLFHWLKRRHVTAQYFTLLVKLQTYGVSRIIDGFLHYTFIIV